MGTARERYLQALDLFCAEARAGADRLGLQSACADWSIADVIRHVTGVQAEYGAGALLGGATADRSPRDLFGPFRQCAADHAVFTPIRSPRSADPVAIAREWTALGGRAQTAPGAKEALDLAIRASIGITVRQPSDVTATDLLRRADVAMYEAKGTRSGALFYDAARDSFSRQRLRLAEDLRRGIDEGQLVVFYQPQIDARSKEVVALEALVRWDHPEDGLLPPIAFLPDARRAGLMLALTLLIHLEDG